MRRWFRVVRAMLGTGVAFAVGGGLIGAVASGLMWLLSGGGDPREMVIVTVGGAMWAFLMGVTFSGLLALTARGRSFEDLSLPRFAALGSAVGLGFFGLLATNAWDAWSTSTALVNATLFVLLGGGSAVGTLILARKAATELPAPDDPLQLDGK